MKVQEHAGFFSHSNIQVQFWKSKNSVIVYKSRRIIPGGRSLLTNRGFWISKSSYSNGNGCKGTVYCRWAWQIQNSLSDSHRQQDHTEPLALNLYSVAWWHDCQVRTKHMQRFKCGQKPGIILPVTWQDTQTPCLPISFVQITELQSRRL